MKIPIQSSEKEAKSTKPTTYTLTVHCSNCGRTFSHNLPYGTEVLNCRCPYCGCRTLSNYRKTSEYDDFWGWRNPLLTAPSVTTSSFPFETILKEEILPWI